MFDIMFEKQIEDIKNGIRAVMKGGVEILYHHITDNPVAITVTISIVIKLPAGKYAVPRTIDLRDLRPPMSYDDAVKESLRRHGIGQIMGVMQGADHVSSDVWEEYQQSQVDYEKRIARLVQHYVYDIERGLSNNS